MSWRILFLRKDFAPLKGCLFIEGVKEDQCFVRSMVLNFYFYFEVWKKNVVLCSESMIDGLGELLSKY